jgi:UDP-N-acetylmuramate dehydrogenase
MNKKAVADKIKFETNTPVKIDEPMSLHTSLRIGGPADLFVDPRGTDNLMRIINIAKEHNIKHFIIGNGTNILVSDEGVRGIVIQIKNGFSRIMMKELGKDLGLEGFEFAAGIPGSIGGAIMMNAGTKLGSISDVTHSIEILTKNGKIKKLKRDELDFEYRNLNLESGAVVLSGVFELKYGHTADVARKLDDFIKERRALQPKGRSAGCIFKNPAGNSAGKLIDKLGLKGKRIGGAYVSKVHANFIMNDGTATCSDFVTLIREVRKTVKDKKGVKLEYEIKFLGNM